MSPEQETRFGFGENWSRYLTLVDETRIIEAETSLKNMLEIDSLEGLTFLDIGSGSGLFSLAARRLGATVHSFDYDDDSVACTTELKKLYFENDPLWHVEQGSALDQEYIESLGKFDIVYSWGVLHHTGAMWDALKLAQTPCKAGGKLFISIYNDQNLRSAMWTQVKKTYCSGPLGRMLVLGVFMPQFFVQGFLRDVVNLKSPIERFRSNDSKRGMSPFYNWIDWLGGYPFEVASPEAIFDFYRADDFSLTRMQTTNSMGCNQFVLSRDS
jgi:SAM-dependent methyltransferase